MSTPKTNPPGSLETIEQLCHQLDLEAGSLDALVNALEADLAVVKEKHLKPLKRQAVRVAQAEASLFGAVETSPDLFQKPRTMTMHGVRVGFVAGKGAVEWDDAESVVAGIRRHHKDETDVLLKTVVTPRKEALRSLTPVDLARLGCRIVDAGDQVVVKRVGGDVEQLIAKLTEKLVARMVTSEE